LHYNLILLKSTLFYSTLFEIFAPPPMRVCCNILRQKKRTAKMWTEYNVTFFFQCFCHTHTHTPSHTHSHSNVSNISVRHTHTHTHTLTHNAHSNGFQHFTETHTLTHTHTHTHSNKSYLPSVTHPFFQGASKIVTKENLN